jgi:hypothetical protein
VKIVALILKFWRDKTLSATITVPITNSAPIVTLASGPSHKGSSREERGRYVADPRVLNDL